MKNFLFFSLNKTSFLIVSFLIILNVIVFSGNLNSDFVWDDFTFIRGNSVIEKLSLENLIKIFNPASEKIAIYKPVTILSFAIDYAVGRGDPFPFHLNNLILHIMNTIIIYVISGRLMGNRWAGFISAVIFAIHPARTPSVVWISERKDVLSGFFFLLTYLLYMKYIENKNKFIYIISIFAFILAILSKPSTITLPVILFLQDYFFRKDFSLKKNWASYIPFFLISMIFAYLQLFVMEGVMPEKGEKYLSLNALEIIVTILLMYGKYIIMFIIPWNLKIIYIDAHYIKILPLTDVIIFPLVILLIIAVTIFLWKKQKFIAFGVLWFIIVLLPALYCYYYPVSMATRYLYLPSIGLSFIIAYLLYKLYELKIYGKYISTGVLIIIIIVFSTITIRDNTAWKNTVTLWEKATKENPDCPGAEKNLASAYIDEKEYDKAIKQLLMIISKPYKDYTTYMLLAQAYEDKGDFKSALNTYEEAIKCYPENLYAYIRAGTIYYSFKEYTLSYKAYSRALEIDPGRKDIEEFLSYLETLKK